MGGVIVFLVFVLGICILLMALGIFNGPSQPDHKASITQINHDTRGQIDAGVDAHKREVLTYLYEKHREELEEALHGTEK